jgi:hypothetical protein
VHQGVEGLSQGTPADREEFRHFHLGGKPLAGRKFAGMNQIPDLLKDSIRNQDLFNGFERHRLLVNQIPISKSHIPNKFQFPNNHFPKRRPKPNLSLFF